MARVRIQILVDRSTLERMQAEVKDEFDSVSRIGREIIEAHYAQDDDRVE